jgi:peptidoglycan hydrolase CwlO-like protein
MLQQYWEKHPVQYEVVQILREGEWVTHVFEWVFMMVSRFAGYIMTLAVGYLILYVIETKHGLDAIPVHSQLSDQLAIFSNIVINVTPELVFPGVVVLCIRAFTVRRWLDGALYLATAVAFAVLTMALLNAFMNSTITREFLSAMLFWRAGAALSYTVVVAYCGGHGGLDFRTLLRELDALREQLHGGQQTVSTLQGQLSTVQQRASTLQRELDGAKGEVSTLRGQLDTERRRVSTLQKELETGQGDTAGLRRELNAALVQVETLQAQLEGKKRELEALRETLESGQEWQESRVRGVLETEQQRIATLQQQLSDEQAAAVALRKQLNAAVVDADSLRQRLEAKEREVGQVQIALRQQLDAKQREAELVRQALEAEQQTVSSLRRALEVEQQWVSTLRQKLDGGQAMQVSSRQDKVDTEQDRTVDGGQHGKVVQLDTSRSHRGDAAENAIAEQIRVLLEASPGLSDRAIAARVGCSPTTVGKRRRLIEGSGQTSTECVNE